MGGGDHICKLNKSASTVKFIFWFKNVVEDLLSRPGRLVVAVDGLISVVELVLKILISKGFFFKTEISQGVPTLYMEHPYRTDWALL